MLEPPTTPLVPIDLQQGVTGRELGPRSSAEVVDQAKRLAARFRALASRVVNVRVRWHRDFANLPSARVDEPIKLPESGLPEGFDAFVEGVMRPGNSGARQCQWQRFTARNCICRCTGAASRRW